MSAVAEHYRRPGLLGRILAAVGDSPIGVDDLAPVDEFHSGGRYATEAITARLGLEPGRHVLDVGCGIGGTARFLAARHGCQVTGVDLTAEFVDTARALTDRVTPDAGIEFRTADATDLPFTDAAFDAVCLLHVGMNIADKDALFAELARVLRPGGACAVFDVMRVGDGEVGFPVPWAGTAALSHLATPAAYRAALDRAGLPVFSEQDWSEAVLRFAAGRRSTPAGGLGPHLMMGDAATEQGHVLAGMRAAVIAPIEMIARRAEPGGRQ